jgi:hypothetical protein
MSISNGNGTGNRNGGGSKGFSSSLSAGGLYSTKFPKSTSDPNKDDKKNKNKSMKFEATQDHFFILSMGQ